MKVFVLILALFISKTGQTQEVFSYKDQAPWEVGTQLGTFLPQHIFRVKDKYPFWGLWLAHPVHLGTLEWQGNIGKAYGVTYYNAIMSLRTEFSAYDFIDGYFRLGVDYHQYKPQASVLREFPERSTFGSHVGFGFYQPLNRLLHGRVDFKFGFGPGNTLLLTLGFVYRFNQEEDNQP